MDEPFADRATERLHELLDVLRDHRAKIDDILERARHIDRQLRAGTAWAAIVEAEEPPLIVELLTESIERLHTASSRFRRAEAHALHTQGLSRQDIARRFGVSRQRVSTLLNTPEPDHAHHGSYRRNVSSF